MINALKWYFMAYIASSNAEPIQNSTSIHHHPRVLAINSEDAALKSENGMFRRLVKDASKDYIVESHVTTTWDGYILKLFRILPPFEGFIDTAARPPVFL